MNNSGEDLYMAKKGTIRMRLVMALALLVGCSKELPSSEFLQYYEKECRTQISHDGIKFVAMPLSSDYEVAKWGVPPDSGMRVLLWMEPFSGMSLEGATLVVGDRAVPAVSIRKTESFELKTVDSYVIAFPEKGDKAKLLLKNVGKGIGNVKIGMKECGHIHLAGRKR